MTRATFFRLQRCRATMGMCDVDIAIHDVVASVYRWVANGTKLTYRRGRLLGDLLLARRQHDSFQNGKCDAGPLLIVIAACVVA
jgi:hypothetical protein